MILHRLSGFQSSNSDRVAGQGRPIRFASFNEERETSKQRELKCVERVLQLQLPGVKRSERMSIGGNTCRGLTVNRPQDV